MNERHGSIDGLRGLAVMGILLMNVTAFALPSGAYFNPLGGGGGAPADLAAWAAGFVLVDGKMRALFSMLFGASTAIVVDRAYAQGRDGARVHFARMATLALFGLAHLVLVWTGDILLHYALLGVIALPCTALEPRQQLRLAILLLLAQLVIGAGFLASFVALRAAALAPHAAAATIADWHALTTSFGIGTPVELAREIALYRGPWSGIAAHAIGTLPQDPIFLFVDVGPETLAYMLIGMAAYRSGFLTGHWPRARYIRAAALGYAIALPPTVALCWLCFHAGFDTLVTYGAATLGGVPFRPLLALADAALAIAWLGTEDSPLRLRLRATGRMAFSNYLGTSLVMTFLFDGWGFGLFGRIERIWLYPIVLAVWAVMLVWSPAWLARYRYGPLEWAWRSLARGQIQPMRRNAIASAFH